MCSISIKIPRRAAPLLVVGGIHVRGQTDLFQIADAGDGLRLFTRLGESGQQHGGEDGEDGDNRRLSTDISVNI